MVSSTAIDLQDYREQVQHACMRLGIHPKMMEHLPALEASELEVPGVPLPDAQPEIVGVSAATSRIAVGAIIAATGNSRTSSRIGLNGFAAPGFAAA